MKDRMASVEEGMDMVAILAADLAKEVASLEARVSALRAAMETASELRLFRAESLVSHCASADPQTVLFFERGGSQSEAVAFVSFESDSLGRVYWEEGCGPSNPNVDHELVAEAQTFMGSELRLFRAESLTLQIDWLKYDPMTYRYAPDSDPYGEPVAFVGFEDDSLGRVWWREGCGPSNPTVDHELVARARDTESGYVSL